MNTNPKTLRAALLLAAFLPFASGALLADTAAAPTPTPATETPLHEIGTPSSAAAAAPTVAPAIPSPTQAPVTTVVISDDSGRRSHDENAVSVGDKTYVGPNEHIPDNAVAVMGSLTVDGIVDNNAVAVMGNNTINGTVHGNAVAVLGDMILGPNARVDGNAVSVGGKVIKDPTAVVLGQLVPVTVAGMSVGDPEGPASSYWKHALRMGRPAAFGPHLHIIWFITLVLIAFHLLLVLIFPAGVAKCNDTLVKRPGITFLTGFLAMLATPVVFILLLATVIGIPVALVVLPLGLLAAIAFGKASLYAFLGQSIIGKKHHLVLAAAVGILVALVFYMIPFLGLAIWFLVAFVGFSTALTALFTSSTPAPAAAVPMPAAAVPPPAPPVQDPAALGVTPPPVADAALAVAQTPPPVPPVPPVMGVSEVTGVRAGFWIRMIALFVDAILVAIVFHWLAAGFLIALAAYGAVLWKLKGSTIGGIIFRLKVVRADGKPIDWVTAIVRSLSCFLSLMFIGLGFLWIAFDPEKQAWHDKIAGTLVVQVPKGISLV